VTAPYAHLFGGTPAPKKADPYAALYGGVGNIDLREPTHGSTGTWGDEDTGIVAQAKHGVGQAVEAVKHLPSTLAGMGKSAAHDFDTVGRLVSAGLGGGNDPSLAAMPASEMARAGVNIAANLALPAAGAMGLMGRTAVNAGLGAINDSEQPIRGATAGVLLGEGLHAAGKGLKASDANAAEQGRASARDYAANVDASLPPDPFTVQPSPAPAPPVKVEAPAAVREAAPASERFSSIPILEETRKNIKNAYRSTLVTPYAAIEEHAPELADALLTAGASKARAQHIGSTRMGRVFDGLTDQQKQDFGTKLVYDNLVAEAQRKHQAALQATDPTEAAQLIQSSDNFINHAQRLDPRVPKGIASEPWFQKSLSQYKTDVEGPLTNDAMASGVDPNSLRKPASAYVRLASEARLDDAEIRRALDVAGVSDIKDLNQRSPFVKKLIGENPALTRYFARNAAGPRQGPLAANAGYPGDLRPVVGKQVGVSGSSKMAMGTAQDYVTDLSRIVDFDARDKAVKAARNQVYSQIGKVGRELAEGEAPAPGKKVLAFDDKKGLVTGDQGIQRYEVSPEVHKAVEDFHRSAQGPSTAGQAVGKLNSLMTRAQIAGMPVEATSHANTLSSIVGAVPGEKDAMGRAVAAIPGVGGKVASIREMLGVDFNDPKTQALENRLADIGALRIEEPHSGLINQSHNWLFGPTGVDKRARLTLARKLLDRAPDATDGQLREFINSQTGNYNAQNAGALPNFMAKGSFLSPFARFQSARIPTAVKRVVGNSSLPASGPMQRLGDVASTLNRGSLGSIALASGATAALTGHSQQENEAGHALDIKTGFYTVPGGIKHMSREEAASYGDRAAPIYIPAATINPVAYAGMRAMGGKALVSRLMGGTDDEGKPVDQRGYASDAVRDVTNVGLGTLGPMMRSLQTAFTGTQPYLQRDNTFLRVAPREPDKNAELLGQIKTALGMANPALHAFSDDAGRSMAGAMAEDGKPFGGAASLAARIAEFTLPRIAAPAIGGKTNAQSVNAQMNRDYTEALADYKRRYRAAPGPIARGVIIDGARQAFAHAGFDAEGVVAALQKLDGTDNASVADKNNRRVEKDLRRRRP
jgi:hypothetical protein